MDINSLFYNKINELINYHPRLLTRHYMINKRRRFEHCYKNGLTTDWIGKHLNKECTLYLHAYNNNKFLYADIDYMPDYEHLISICNQLALIGLYPIIERSQSGNRLHFWFFFKDIIPKDFLLTFAIVFLFISQLSIDIFLPLSLGLLYFPTVFAIPFAGRSTFLDNNLNPMSFDKGIEYFLTIQQQEVPIKMIPDFKLCFNPDLLRDNIPEYLKTGMCKVPTPHYIEEYNGFLTGIIEKKYDNENLFSFFGNLWKSIYDANINHIFRLFNPNPHQISIGQKIHFPIGYDIDKEISFKKEIPDGVEKDDYYKSKNFIY